MFVGIQDILNVLVHEVFRQRAVQSASNGSLEELLIELFDIVYCGYASIATLAQDDEWLVVFDGKQDCISRANNHFAAFHMVFDVAGTVGCIHRFAGL